jgi:hypothetical protein
MATIAQEDFFRGSSAGAGLAPGVDSEWQKRTAAEIRRRTEEIHALRTEVERLRSERSHK